MGLHSRGATFLAGRQKASESETVVITRTGTFTDKSVAAVIGGPGFGVDEQIDIPGRIGEWKVDFIIRVTDWTTAGCTGTPAINDKIVRTIGGVEKTFRVMSDSNIPAWDWGEPEQVTYRVHARYEP